MFRWLLIFAALSTQAQTPDPILETIKADQAWTLEQQISICQIPAPPFKETERGKEFARRLATLDWRTFARIVKAT